MPSPLRPGAAALLLVAAVGGVAEALSVGGSAGGGGAGAAPRSDDRVRQEIIDEFDGVDNLCQYFNWDVRDKGSQRPQIIYATIVGNNGQQDVYDLSFAEIHPLVSRIVALDPAMTQKGANRTLSINLSEARWQRYLPKLRHIVLESPTAGTPLELLSQQQRQSLERPGHALMNHAQHLEQWTRAQLKRGLQNSSGSWDMDPDDILLVADSDEIPLRETLVALVECESPNFARVRNARAAKDDMREACKKNAKVLLKSQVFEYYLDCPTMQPVWWHPDAVLASCVMEGGLDVEDVRTGSSGTQTPHLASRHVHNLGMSDDDVIFKYAHYAEARMPGESGLTTAEQDEMRWRACDPQAPQLGPANWHMKKRPFADFVSGANRRGWQVPEIRRRGVSKPFALLRERSDLAHRFYWTGYAERENPFVGGHGGPHSFYP